MGHGPPCRAASVPLGVARWKCPSFFFFICWSLTFERRSCQRVRRLRCPGRKFPLFGVVSSHKNRKNVSQTVTCRALFLFRLAVSELSDGERVSRRRQRVDDPGLFRLQSIVPAARGNVPREVDPDRSCVSLIVIRLFFSYKAV